MGLRLAEGVDLGRIAGLAGREPVDRGTVDRLAAQGLLTLDGDCLSATPAGMLLLDRILAEIAA